MLLSVKSCTFNIFQHYGNVINRNKLSEVYHSRFLNLNNNPFICQLFNIRRNLFVTDTNIEKYLVHLMNTYQSDHKGKGSISEILKLHEIPRLLNEKIKITENIKSLHDLGKDEEIKNLVKEEELTYTQQLLQIDQEILNITLGYIDIEHYNNVIMEIVPGVGGQEAMVFAKDLLNMYISYFKHLEFSYEIIEMLDSGIGGLRKAVLLISNSNAFKKLKYESGIHRVQRNPITEKSSRLHTSTAVVVILPEPKDVEIKLLDKDLIIETKKASGAGGQHVNTTDSAVRITHIPTGTVVTCQSDRSQIKNKQLALTKLRTILYEEYIDEQASFSNKIRKKQMGKRLRNEKIRTYNYLQNRVTDHRITDGTIYNLREFMINGAVLEKFEDKLYKDLQLKTLQEIIEEIMTQSK
ncbi:PREDICTED: peptide chain release factor 1 [Eufriesea mexicana]|uniref:peptide chain release factor 1 n=1 Tax=Eufriesea mexicana TaxID=516756 RepID=UPI00083C7E7C|nr:PREDICTED: peptide chain release factor 1 [Eufriesea mexicana]